ncbi:hypothetical protein ACH5RR_035371 [Cinchona calisaya]|uniref:Stress-response A/B barrel domain-containing protein n=1 Tax=Cinchona calisaya TaxID=153742 RepID=A0ABD2YH46_9GENT
MLALYPHSHLQTTILPPLSHHFLTIPNYYLTPTTRILYSRYASKSDLDTYSAHLDHVVIVIEYVRPIVKDVMAIDWISSGASLISVPLGSAMRVALLKLKEDLGENEKNEGVNELEALDLELEAANKQKDLVRNKLEIRRRDRNGLGRRGKATTWNI